MMSTGELSSEQEILENYPMLYFHHQAQIHNFLQKRCEFSFVAGDITVRVNIGDTGTGKTTDAYVCFFL